jgi:hypothetical protein
MTRFATIERTFGRQTRQPLLPLTMAETEPSGEGRVASRMECAVAYHLLTIPSSGTVQGSVQRAAYSSEKGA